jgi:hypothetical protein
LVAAIHLWPLARLAGKGRARVRVEFAHLRSAANAGVALKPHDMFGISLCRVHHDEQHRLGALSFGRTYQIDQWALATEFAQRSPDWEMRASLKLICADQIGAR